MPLSSILALAGCAALLIGLLGGGLKAKEVVVPKISLWTRIISASVGVILIGVSLWLFFSQTQQLPVETNPTATAVSTSSETTTTTIAENHAPVLKSVVIREDLSKGYLILYQDVSYYDLDGDAEYVDWTLVSTTKQGEVVSDGQIYDSVEQQKKGSIFTGVWNCSGGEYSVIVQAIVIDKAGNKSEPLEYNLNCR